MILDHNKLGLANESHDGTHLSTGESGEKGVHLYGATQEVFQAYTHLANES